MTLPIRVRLTIWTVLLLALTLGVFAGAVYEFMERQERISADRVLRDRASAFARSYASELTEEPSEQAIVEASRNFVFRDSDAFIYAPPFRLVSRSPSRLLGGDPAVIPAVRRSIGVAFRGETHFVRAAPSIRVMVTPLGHGFVLVVTESVASELEALRRAREAFALAIPAALLIAAVGAYILARRGLAPVGDIVETASRIEAENLSMRIPVARHDDEIGRLGAVLNALFDRLERSFAQQRQLIADTSHELRTPVTIIRSEAEVALSRERDPADYRKALEIVRSESAHLTHLIESVLMLARADARQIRIDRDEFSLKEVIDESVRTAETLGRSRTIRLAANSEGPMPMVGDAELVRRMMLNLLENAIKFSDSGGEVGVRAHRDGARYVITVSDSGHGIPAEDQPQIFDRFFRSDRVRGRDGSGLGLPIVKWIAEAHGGDARLLRSTASGSVFEVTLQGAPADAALGSSS